MAWVFENATCEINPSTEKPMSRDLLKPITRVIGPFHRGADMVREPISLPRQVPFSPLPSAKVGFTSNLMVTSPF